MEEFLYIIILVVLIYMFEHKILPTLICLILSTLKLSDIVTDISQAEVIYAYMYAILILYAGYMIFVSEKFE